MPLSEGGSTLIRDLAVTFKQRDTERVADMNIKCGAKPASREKPRAQLGPKTLTAGGNRKRPADEPEFEAVEDGDEGSRWDMQVGSRSWGHEIYRRSTGEIEDLLS